MSIARAPSGLEQLIADIEAGRQAPVDSWNPPHCGDSDMRIASDGSWFHEGTRITRPALVRLFASILRREGDGSFVLVTPVEKLSITVEDAPFIATALETEGEGPTRRLGFRLNTGEAVIAGPDHMLHVDAAPSGPRPYIEVRRGLEALIARPVYYELATLAIEEAATPPGLWSDGMFFALDETR